MNSTKTGRLKQALPRYIASSAGILLILSISLAVLVVLAFLLSKTPGKTLSLFFVGPLKNTYYLGNMINSAIPLIFGGLGASIAMRAGNINLGGEGQIYAGALVATVLTLALAPLGIAGAILALTAGAVVSGCVAALSGLLKTRWNTSELITTFLVSNALMLITSYFITGPLLDPNTNLQSTRKIAESFRLPQIMPPSNLSAALFFALAAVLGVHLFLHRTRMGYELRLSGQNGFFGANLFARYGGINTGWSMILSMFLSGLLYGLGGGMAIYGTYYATMKDFSSGMGWNGLAVALIARSRPAAVIPAAIFFSWIGSGARLAMQFSDVTFEISSIVQSVVFFLVTSVVLQDAFKRKGAAK
ncbi:ABC transporter permease [Spirochaetia bacterium]|nr:ABC transporter permease [Spirochaetia bacterium]